MRTREEEKQVEQQNGQPNGQEPPRQGVPDAAKTEKGAIHSYLLDKWAEACPVQARIVRGLQTARKVLRIIGAIGALLVVLMMIVLTAMRMQVSLVLLTVMQVFMYIGLFLAVPCLGAVYVLNIVHALYANSRCCGWLTETGQDAAALLGADLRYYAGKARRYEKITMSKDAAYLSLRPKRKPLYLSGFILSLVSVAFVISFFLTGGILYAVTLGEETFRQAAIVPCGIFIAIAVAAGVAEFIVQRVYAAERDEALVRATFS